MTLDCTGSVHQDGCNGCAAELSLTKYNQVPMFLCTEALRLVHSSGNRFLKNHQGKHLQMVFLMDLSTEK